MWPNVLTKEQTEARWQELIDQQARTAYAQIRDTGWVAECDPDINAGSDALIERMGKGCWLGHINLYDYTPEQQWIMWQWKGEHIYNFCADFVLPQFDQQLHDMIKARHEAEYTGTAGDYPLVMAITERIEAVGGKMLLWA